MSNQFKTELAEDDFEEEVKSPNTDKIELPRNFFTLIFTEGVISKQAATGMLPFIIFLAFLAMIYIANRHFAENNIREIDKLNKQVKELNWDFKTLKADLMLKSTQTEVSKQVSILGLKEPIEPPKKIVVSIEEN